MTKVY